MTKFTDFISVSVGEDKEQCKLYEDNAKAALSEEGKTDEKEDSFLKFHVEQVTISKDNEALNSYCLPVYAVARDWKLHMEKLKKKQKKKEAETVQPKAPRPKRQKRGARLTKAGKSTNQVDGDTNVDLYSESEKDDDAYEEDDEMETVFTRSGRAVGKRRKAGADSDSDASVVTRRKVTRKSGKRMGRPPKKAAAAKKAAEATTPAPPKKRKKVQVKSPSPMHSPTDNDPIFDSSEHVGEYLYFEDIVLQFPPYCIRPGEPIDWLVVDDHWKIRHICPPVSSRLSQLNKIQIGDYINSDDLEDGETARDAVRNALSSCTGGTLSFICTRRKLFKELFCLRGKLINPTSLHAAVRELGGFEQVNKNQKWQTVRTSCGLKDCINSTDILSDAYKAYFMMNLEESEVPKPVVRNPDKGDEGAAVEALAG
mmetsp:Transcript_11452/g.24813  ORF Transcript_11452/g.24813 Transcript_11452/m.24813 type:complete len:426 (-) Transcript_11452:929-2206(-)|eukprot:CAMPEP_0203765124 /NCGR_PEP_ID=MMETSP0098-20131031/18236_1 /ASSEMBLY_ACC=CAM_ASM_000208 /TAXON_ID=96639 /ORGANISM=" , Strain NY0313808BC1" /LENGTH=425 /DNA_ID=CAMNT_0050661349 /DNA_START=274 /DNA_END=1551 /DNA_ORIENTATION=-